MRAARLGVGLSVTLGAGLYWWVQPLIAEGLVARHGGGAEVWTACLVFFQLALLGGYAYAHALSWLCSPRRALGVHGALACLAAALFDTPGLADAQVTPGPLTWAVFTELSLALGPAVLALGATSPLLQRAHHHLTKRAPWRLYALANLVALILLILHPLVLEPLISQATQAGVWRALLIVYGLGCLVLARVDGSPEPLRTPQALRPQPAWRWILLAACASALLLATSESMSRDVASTPLLWSAPLAAFLLSVIVTFDRPRLYRRGPTLLLMVLAVSLLFWVSLSPLSQPFALRAGAHLCVLFVGCTLCHGELYRGRPEAEGLTGYHLSMALGGALGGLGVAVAAPWLLDRVVELPLVIGLTLLALSLSLWREASGRRLVAYGGAGLALSLALIGAFGLSALESSPGGQERVIERSRSVHGALTLVERRGEGPARRLLVDGNTTHGAQRLEGEGVTEPTLYYARETGVAEAFRHVHQRSDRVDVGLIGLGVGTLAAYGRAGDAMVFYELNPEVVRLAQERFTFLASSQALVSVEVGDGRARLARRAESEPFDLLVIDAFRSDAIPTHLLTREALRLYRARLVPEGVVAFHLTNRTLDLVGVVEALAADAGVGIRVITTGEGVTWALLGADLEPPPEAPQAVWTDDYAPVLSALRP